MNSCIVVFRGEKYKIINKTINFFFFIYINVAVHNIPTFYIFILYIITYVKHDLNELVASQQRKGPCACTLRVKSSGRQLTSDDKSRIYYIRIISLCYVC